jgi:hypothetical protein
LFESYYYFKENKEIFFNSTSNSNSKEILHNSARDQDRGHKLNRALDLEKTGSSGRKQLWQNSLLLIKEKKIILGYGPKADRFLLTELHSRNEKNKYYRDSYGNNFVVESNVSNALIYAYLSGGLLGFLLLLTINVLASITIFKNIFIEKIFLSKDTVKLFSTTLLMYLGTRSIFENSYSTFGIDYIFFTLSYVTYSICLSQ